MRSSRSSAPVQVTEIVMNNNKTKAVVKLRVGSKPACRALVRGSPHALCVSSFFTMVNMKGRASAVQTSLMDTKQETIFEHRLVKFR